MVPPAKAKTSWREDIFLVAVVRDHRPRNLVAKYKVRYKLLSLPAADNVAGISDRRWPFIGLWHYSNLLFLRPEKRLTHSCLGKIYRTVGIGRGAYRQPFFQFLVF